eukprot:scaffold10394_cov173-Amphora_coffeaeformis.AAC.6
MYTAEAWRRLVRIYLLLLLSGCFLPQPAEAFSSQSKSRSVTVRPTNSPLTTQIILASSSDNGNVEKEEDLLAKAARLRQEAKDLETTLRSATTTSSREKKDAAIVTPPPVYTQISDSIWTFTYRFTIATERNTDDDASSPPPLPKYSGKLTLHLLANGYTDLLLHIYVNNGLVEICLKQIRISSFPAYLLQLKHEAAVPSQALDIVKAWGWDLEQSEEQDDKTEYVLFSIDFMVPDDKTNGGKKKERFYFQARQDKDGKGVLALQDGTVTVKQDVTETRDGSSSFWGLFSPKGILARFTYVGNFAARPSSKVEK